MICAAAQRERTFRGMETSKKDKKPSWQPLVAGKKAARGLLSFLAGIDLEM